MVSTKTWYNEVVIIRRNAYKRRIFFRAKKKQPQHIVCAVRKWCKILTIAKKCDILKDEPDKKCSVMAGTHVLHLSDTEHYAQGETYLVWDDFDILSHFWVLFKLAFFIKT